MTPYRYINWMMPRQTQTEKDDALRREREAREREIEYNKRMCTLGVYALLVVVLLFSPTYVGYIKDFINKQQLFIFILMVISNNGVCHFDRKLLIVFTLILLGKNNEIFHWASLISLLISFVSLSFNEIKTYLYNDNSDDEYKTSAQ